MEFLDLGWVVVEDFVGLAAVLEAGRADVLEGFVAGALMGWENG